MLTEQQAAVYAWDLIGIHAALKSALENPLAVENPTVAARVARAYAEVDAALATLHAISRGLPAPTV